MKKYLFALFIINLFQTASALEDSLSMRALHGGTIQKTDHAIIELVQDKERTSLYITGHDRKQITNEKLSLSAIAHVNGSSIPVSLNFENDHYSLKPANSYMRKENNWVLSIQLSFDRVIETVRFKLRPMK